ncbi:MAG: hypothetical protein C0523_10820 [Cytophaga sp.]|nr:hypothetical protein [Cytophaga sp.]
MIMKTMTKMMMVAALGLFMNTAFAQEHSHGSPHKGEVKSSGNYHVEMVKSMDMSGGKMADVFTFYLLDKGEKTLPAKGKTGSVTAQGEDGKTAKFDLQVTGEDMFVFNAAGKEYVNLIVTIKDGGNTATAKFNVKDKEKHDDGHKH